MPDQVFECERCGSPVPLIDIQRGKAIKLAKGVLCFGCSESITTDQKDALKDQVSGKKPPQTPARGSTRTNATPAPAPAAGRATPTPAKTASTSRRISKRRKASSGRASERRTATSTSTTRATRRVASGASGKAQSRSGGGGNTILAVGPGGGILVGVIVAVVASQSGGEPRTSRRNTEKPGQTAVLASGQQATVSAADAGLWATDEQDENVNPRSATVTLDQIRSMVDPSLSRHDDICTALDTIMRLKAGTPEADEARALRAGIDRTYEDVADGELASALEASKAMLARGDRSGAESPLKRVRVKFYGSDWLRNKGEPKIAAALKELGAAGEPGASAVGEYPPSEVAADRNPADEGSISDGEEWDRFLVDLAQAGREGLKKAGALLVDRKKSANRSPAFAAKIARLDKIQHDAEVVQSLMNDCIASSERMLRLQWQDRPYSGKVTGFKNGVVTIKPLHGDPAEIPLDEVPAEDILLASGILRGGGLGYDRACAYCLARGNLPAAQEYLKEADADKTADLAACIDDLASATANVSPPVPPVQLPAVTEADTAAEDPVTVAKATPSAPKPAAEVKFIEEPLPGETGMPGEWAPGLIARVIDGAGACVAARIDAHPGRLFSSGGPDAAMPDGCRVEWTGWLMLPHKGIYTFEITSWDRLEMILDGKPLLSANNAPSPERVYEMGLHPVRLVATGGTCAYSLSWTLAGLKKELIPGDYFFHEVPPPGTVGPPAKLVQGLKAEYFVGANLDRKVAESVTTTTDYNSREFPPVSMCPKDRFSIRLSGYVQLDFTEEYEIAANADDGVRVLIDDKLVIDHWLARNTTPLKITETLQAGIRKLVVEYNDNTSEASGNVTVMRMQDLWAGNVLPGRLLRDAAPPTIVSRKGFIPGLVGRFYTGEKPGAGKAILDRYDPLMVFRWDGMPPVREMNPDNFSAVWAGVLIAPERGLYQFIVYHDDGVSIVVNGRPVLNKWNASAGWVSGTVPLREGPAKIQISYFNRAEKSGLEIYWAGPSFGFKALGASDLVCQADELVIAPPWEDAVVIPQRVAAAGGPKTLPGQEPKADAPGRAPWPDEKPDDKPVEKPPEGNLVFNGGFEKLGEDGKWPERWNSHNWGTGSARFYVRSDITNPHEGERAIMVRASGEGALPGVFSGVPSMPPGKYELRFWACADVDVKARVHAHLAGKDFDPISIGEEWAQYKFTVEIKEKRQSNAPIRLWTSTIKAKVWFDDVEVEYVP